VTATDFVMGAEIYVVVLGGNEPGTQIFYTDCKAQFDRVDCDLPELDLDVLAESFVNAGDLASALETFKSNGFVVQAEKWGFC